MAFANGLTASTEVLLTEEGLTLRTLAPAFVGAAIDPAEAELVALKRPFPEAQMDLEVGAFALAGCAGANLLAGWQYLTVRGAKAAIAVLTAADGGLAAAREQAAQPALPGHGR